MSSFWGQLKRSASQILTPNFGNRKSTKRAFSAAKSTNATYGWDALYSSINTDLSAYLTTLRGRSREKYYNNDIAKRFVQLCTTHLVGETGISLQVHSQGFTEKQASRHDEAIEAGWNRWAKRGNCDVTGKLSLKALLKVVVECCARDGEVLIRLVQNYPNAYGFALQLIEADCLDVAYTQRLTNGNTVVMGVEVDGWGKPVAYHITTQHPGELLPSARSYERVRVPAEQIIHPFIPVRPNQMRGLPWMHASLFRMNLLGSYEDAEVTAARVGAAKMGFYLPKEDLDEEEIKEVDEQGRIVADAEPGAFEVAPSWVRDVKEFKSDHPNANYGQFDSSQRRTIASGLGVSHHHLSNDLTDVNFSSIRSGTLEERDHWRTLQCWLKEDVLTPIYEQWLAMQMVTGTLAVPVTFALMDSYPPTWYARSWEWVDPVKDRTANLLAVRSGEKSISDVIRASGKDPDTVLQDIKKSRELFGRYGLEDLWQNIYFGNGASKNGNPARNDTK